MKSISYYYRYIVRIHAGIPQFLQQGWKEHLFGARLRIVVDWTWRGSYLSGRRKKKADTSSRNGAKKVDVPISVDTQRAQIAEDALNSGATIINDISGFKGDPEMPKVASKHNSWAILMANRISGRIRTAEKDRGDIKRMEDIKEGLKESPQICRDNGIDIEKDSLDPGIGFGREKDWGLKIIARMEELLDFGLPICLGVSRKSFIGKVLGLDSPSERPWGFLGATAVAVMKGAHIVRTHDPLETTQLVRMIEAIQEKEVD